MFKSNIIYRFFNIVKAKILRLIVENCFQVKKFAKLKHCFENKRGIEIGGVSKIFLDTLPIYQLAQNIDGCNFSKNTIWEGNLQEGNNYNFYKNKTGFQYICEASKLDHVEDNKYDFLISSHCLEHCANAMKTVKEWIRVVKKGGVILIIVPDTRFIFDHKRPTTKFSHLIEDFEKNISENDLTHFDEIIQLHDLSLDIPAGDLDNFKTRSLDNYNNRCLHHHIFDFELLSEIFNYFNIEILYKEFIKPCHQVIIGKKV
ncbi:MAG: methyltransferase domain-containing protein [Chitinophagales bacterium]